MSVLGGGLLYGWERSGKGNPTSFFSREADRSPARGKTTGPGSAAVKGWSLAPFWLPVVYRGEPTLVEIRVALQVAAPFSPEEGTIRQRALREAVWTVLRAPEENLFQAEGRSRVQEALTGRLNERFYQGTLKGVMLEILPLS